MAEIALNFENTSMVLWLIVGIVITILLTIIFTLEKIHESNNMNEKYSEGSPQVSYEMREYMEHTKPDIKVVITMKKGKPFTDGSRLSFDGYEGIFRTTAKKEYGKTISGVVYFKETQLYGYKKGDFLNITIPDKNLMVVANAKIEAIYNDALRARVGG